jgi:cytochrome c556
MRRIIAAAVIGTACLIAVEAAAQSPAEMVETRKIHYKDLGGSFKAVNDQLKREKPDLASVRGAAGEVKEASEQSGTWFPKGSGPEAGVKTRAKPAIWKEPAKFNQLQANFRTEAAKLAAVTAGADLDTMRVQAKATGETCAACHNSYRDK